VDSSPILPDILAEAERLMGEVGQQGIEARVTGGVAVALHGHGHLHPAFRREYHDIDLVTISKQSRRLGSLLVDCGYQANSRFNAMNGSSRMVFYDLGHERQLDVFVGGFEMCHRIPIASRLHADPVTVPLAELLLTKLQIVQLNDKDVLDLLAILYHHDVASSDGDTVNGKFVAELLAGDWGLWRTATSTLMQLKDRIAASALDEAGQTAVRARIDVLCALIDAEPKGLRWRSRAKIGDRVKWYSEPEEIAHVIGGNRP
jgi:hypothetical protein